MPSVDISMTINPLDGMIVLLRSNAEAYGNAQQIIPPVQYPQSPPVPIVRTPLPRIMARIWEIAHRAVEKQPDGSPPLKIGAWLWGCKERAYSYSLHHMGEEVIILNHRWLNYVIVACIDTPTPIGVIMGCVASRGLKTVPDWKQRQTFQLGHW
jgi:hypothetical protein